MSTLKGRRTGVSVKKVEVDSLGMEDLDQFWGAEASANSSPKYTKQVYAKLDSDEEDDHNFDYDTSDSISDEIISDEEDTADEMELIRANRPLALSTIDKVVDSSTMSISMNASNESSLPLEDSFVTRETSEMDFVNDSSFKDVPGRNSKLQSEALRATRESFDSIGAEFETSHSKPDINVTSELTSRAVIDIKALDSLGDSNRNNGRRLSVASDVSDFGPMDDNIGFDEDLMAVNQFAAHDISPVVGRRSPELVTTGRGKKTRISSSEKRRVSFGDDVIGASSRRGQEVRPLVSSRSSVSPNPRTSTLHVDSSSVASTPSSAMGLSMMSTPASDEFPRGRPLSDETYIESSQESSSDESIDEEGVTDKSGFTDTSYLQAIRRRGPLTSSQLESGHYVEDDEELGPVRRSSRATKGVKFAFWKGERVIYEQGGQLAGILKAEPTPKKQKIVRKRKLTKVNQLALDREQSSDEDQLDWTEPKQKDFDEMPAPIKLPANVKYIDREEALDRGLLVWRHDDNSVVPVKVVCCKDRMPPPTALPITADRRSKKSKGAFAASYFYTPSVSGILPSWIAGYVELPPGAIKDEEAVGECSQVFFIGDCQDRAVEVGIADPSSEVWVDAKAQRLMLSKGDSFYVPPGNIYRLENHSTTKPCTIFWNIIKPVESNVINAPEEEYQSQYGAAESIHISPRQHRNASSAVAV